MKKRLMIMNNDLYGGGAEKVMQTLLNNLDSSKYEITLYSLTEKVIDKTIYTGDFTYKYIFDSLNEYDSKFSTLLKKTKNKFKLMIYKFCLPRVFYKLFIKGIYDTEIAFIEGESTRIISGSSNKNSKKIAWVHIDLEKNHWTKVAFNSFSEEIWCYKAYDNIVCVSGSVADSFKRFYGINENVITKYNPVDSFEITEKSKETIDNIELYNRPILVTAGRLVEQKGYDRLLEVVNKLVCEGHRFTLWIIGEGEQQQLLEQYIDENNLQGYVKLLGFQMNPYKYMKQADLFVCSSRAEGFSTVATEAIILGKAIITTDCSGMHELLGDSEYGSITNNDTNSLYLHLKKVLLNPNLIDYYEIKAKERSKLFNVKNTIKAIEDIL